MLLMFTPRLCGNHDSNDLMLFCLLFFFNWIGLTTNSSHFDGGSQATDKCSKCKQLGAPNGLSRCRGPEVIGSEMKGGGITGLPP